MRVLCLLMATLCFSLANAHPEDEFCVPGEDGLDPALCAALAELDSASSTPGTTRLEPVLDAEGKQRSALSTASLYLSIGVAHILPDGIDHILFVLALVLATVRLKKLVLQVSAFTVAHTVTLALAAAGFLSVPTNVVEPLIAITIAFVALENLYSTRIAKWRPLLVFGFGLIHGLGFAGFVAELGLPDEQFWSALIGFNVGVEIGQLSIVIVAATVGYFLRRRCNELSGTRLYRHIVVLPGSAAIAVCGLWWAADRALF